MREFSRRPMRSRDHAPTPPVLPNFQGDALHTIHVNGKATVHIDGHADLMVGGKARVVIGGHNVVKADRSVQKVQVAGKAQIRVPAAPVHVHGSNSAVQVK
jgi:cytoskeletal protein CcmA (bactofilin family)